MNHRFETVSVLKTEIFFFFGGGGGEELEFIISRIRIHSVKICFKNIDTV